MYKIESIDPAMLDQIPIDNQQEIEQYIGSPLNLKEAYKEIKKRSKGFTEYDPEAEQADQLLFDLVKSEGVIPLKEEKPDKMLFEEVSEFEKEVARELQRAIAFEEEIARELERAIQLEVEAENKMSA